MNVVTNNKWIGQRTIRPDGMDKVTGRAQFAADTTMPGMIWGKVLRSPHPHARIKSIDTSKAENLPGVKAVVTAKDIVDFTIEKGAVMLGIQDMRWMCRNVMAREKVLFPGHPVAAVAATSEAIAAGPVGIAAIYGGYFGAGLSVIVLAFLGLPIDDELTAIETYTSSRLDAADCK
jgi:CO/xanthine dehydrogenase Mo-binding subunit